jgi:hypothetical protein
MLSKESISMKTTKYQPLINILITKGWKITPLMVFVAGTRATTHIPSMKYLELQLKDHGY